MFRMPQILIVHAVIKDLNRRVSVQLICEVPVRQRLLVRDIVQDDVNLENEGIFLHVRASSCK